MDNEEYEYYLSLDKWLVGRVWVDFPVLHLMMHRGKSLTSPGQKDHSKRAPAAHDMICRAASRHTLFPGASYPKLNTTGAVIYCFNGRHRLKAFEYRYGENDRWWVIELYSLEPNLKYKADYQFCVV